jgi:hypothetical protein
MKKLISLVFACFVISASVSSAAPTYSGYVSEIYADASGSYVNYTFQLKDASGNKIVTSCPEGTGNYFFIFNSQNNPEASKVWYAAILMAIANGKTIYVNTDGSCSSGRMKINSLRINN